MSKTIIKRTAAVLSALCTILMCVCSLSRPNYCAGRYMGYYDINDDYVCDGQDLIIMGEYLSGKDVGGARIPDIDHNGKVNVLDYLYLKRFLVHDVIPGQSWLPQPTEDLNDPDMVKGFMEKVLSITNEERAKVGAAPLTLSDKLCDAAMVRAKEIVGKFSHTRPDGSSCFTVLDSSGIGYHYVGENIAAGRSGPEGTMDQWINSKGHYENIINSRFTELGVGYVYNKDSEYGYYWVQLFREP